MKKLLLSVLAIGSCSYVAGFEYGAYGGRSSFTARGRSFEEEERIRERDRERKRLIREMNLAAKQRSKALVDAYRSWRLRAAGERDEGKPITPWQPPS